MIQLKVIPHADFSHDLIVKLRQDWEPDFINSVLPTEIKGYHILFCLYIHML